MPQCHKSEHGLIYRIRHAAHNNFNERFNSYTFLRGKLLFY